MKLVDDIINTFTLSEIECIKTLMKTTLEFELYPNKDQIWASILVLSDASLNEVVKILPHAKKDWRDVVIASGFAIDNWEQVAEKWVRKKSPSADAYTISQIQDDTDSFAF